LSPRTAAEVSRAGAPECLLSNVPARLELGWCGSLLEHSLLSEADLVSALSGVSERRPPMFRTAVGGRCVADFRVGGTPRLRLARPDCVLNPLLATMVALAEGSLERPRETLALLQLIVNHFRDGSQSLPDERFGSSRICVFMGASREVVLSGQPRHMVHGDALLLGADATLSLPPCAGVPSPSVLLCLCFGSAEAYAAGLSVLPVEGGARPSSRWWAAPGAAAEGGAGAEEDELLGGGSALEAEYRARWLADRARAEAGQSREAKETLERARREARERQEMRKQVETATRDDLQKLLNARIGRISAST